LSRKILLYGDSHSEAIFRAVELRKRKRKPTPIDVHRARRQKGEKLLGDTSLEEFLELARGLGADDVVVTMIGGNQHAVFSTVQHPVRFDVIEPGMMADHLEPGAEIIPYRMVSSLLDSALRGRDGRSLKALRDATPARIMLIIPPPPKRDGEFIRNYHETRFANDIAELGVSSAELRMKIWRMQRNLLHSHCRELNIESLDPPQNAVDPDGYLLPEYYANDATHANRDYGLLLLRVLEQRFGTERKGVA
jgi:hypothetical protein